MPRAIEQTAPTGRSPLATATIAIALVMGYGVMLELDRVSRITIASSHETLTAAQRAHPDAHPDRTRYERLPTALRSELVAPRGATSERSAEERALDAAIDNLLEAMAARPSERFAIRPDRPSAAAFCTSLFVHKSLVHVGMNLLLLIAFGSRIERRSRRLFVAVVVAAWLGASTLGIALARIDAHAVIGASGITLGITAGAAVLDRSPTRWIAAFIAGALAIAPLFDAASGIAHETHLGGVIGGVLVALIYVLATMRRRTLDAP